MTESLSPLQEISDIKSNYSSEYFSLTNTGFVDEFFIPCLSKSIHYKRISAFYNSEVLIYLFQGIKHIISKGGKIHLLLGCIPQKEFDIANDNERKRRYEEEFVERILDEEEFPHETNRDTKRALIQLFAWLIDQGILQIKLGFILDKNKRLANRDEIQISLSEGILHDKIGIFVDEEGNKVGFQGSLNETVKGLLCHEEFIDVHKSWEIYPDKEENEHLEGYERIFDKLWNNQSSRMRVYSLPNDLLKKIRKSVPKDYSSENLAHDYEIIDEFYREIEEDYPFKVDFEEEFDPFKEIVWKNPPQTESYERWLVNDRKGILSIATGVGKTLIAIRAIHEFLNEKNIEKKRIVIVSAHNLFMIQQWKDEISKWLTNPADNTIIAHMIDIKGKRGLTILDQINELKNYSFPFNDKIIILSHYDIISRFLVKELNIVKDECEFLFIADEAHEMGSELRKTGFAEFHPNFKMGLTATPKRYFDPEGTNFLNEFFRGDNFPEGIIFEYSLGDAIRDEFLCSYNYIPVTCDMTTEEIKKYEKLSKAIAVAMSEDIVDKEKLNSLQRNRKRIIKKAFNKINIITNLVTELKMEMKDQGLKYFLIYLEDTIQLKEIKYNLIETDIITSEIIQSTSPENRNNIIERFRRGQIPIILAIQILDQGVNIPELRTAIIGSSTGNEKQFIQRRGRLLRNDPKTGKKIAVIYDIVIPSYENQGERIEIKSEVERMKMFTENSNNKKQIYELVEKWGVDFD